MGSKGDVTIEGVGGAEPRNDYTPFSEALPSDFPDFDDGAGEIEEIPGGLPNDGTLFYFQSSYDFFQFPGSDGFFGFSNDTTYPLEGRKETYWDVLAPGDYYVSFDNNRFYSYLDNVSDSYVHMAERDLEVTGGGIFTIWPDRTIEVLRKYTVSSFSHLWPWLPSITVSSWDIRLLWVRSSQKNHWLAKVWFSTVTGGEINRSAIIYSEDGGASWDHVSGIVWDQVGGQNAHQDITVLGEGWGVFDRRILFIKDNESINDIIRYGDHDFDIWSAVPGATWDSSGAGTRKYVLADSARMSWGGGGIIAKYRIQGAPIADGQYEWYIGRIRETGEEAHALSAAFEPNGPVTHQGVDEFDGYGQDVIWIKEGFISLEIPPRDHFFVAIQSGVIGDPGPNSTWNDTAWKSRVMYFHGPSGLFEDRGVGWQASSKPDFDNFETIIHFDVYHIELMVNGDKTTWPVPWFITRYATRTSGGGTSNIAWDYPGYWNFPEPGSDPYNRYQWEYKIYTSSDLGESYDLVHTLDTHPLGGPVDEAYEFAGGWFPKNPVIVWGSANAPRAAVPLWGIDAFRQSGDPPVGPGGEYGYAAYTLSFAYFTGIDFEGGILAPQQVSPPRGVFRQDVFNRGIQYASAGVYAKNLLTIDEGEIAWRPSSTNAMFKYGNSMIEMGRETNLNEGLPGDQIERWVMKFSEPQYDYYTYDRIVCTSAGFTIRAPHVNELKTKLQQLNANVRTAGTTIVDFGLEFTMPDGNLLPEVAADNEAQPVRDDHYFTLRREVDKVIGQIAEEPGSEFYCTDCDLLDYSDLMNSQPVAEDEQVSIRTLLGMRKTLQALYASGFFCSCYSYCPCQTFVDISIEGGKK